MLTRPKRPSHPNSPRPLAVPATSPKRAKRRPRAKPTPRTCATSRNTASASGHCRCRQTPPCRHLPRDDRRNQVRRHDPPAHGRDRPGAQRRGRTQSGRPPRRTKSSRRHRPHEDRRANTQRRKDALTKDRLEEAVMGARKASGVPFVRAYRRGGAAALQRDRAVKCRALAATVSSDHLPATGTYDAEDHGSG